LRQIPARMSSATRRTSSSPASAAHPATTASTAARGAPARHTRQTASGWRWHHSRSRYNDHRAPGRLTGSASLHSAANVSRPTTSASVTSVCAQSDDRAAPADMTAVAVASATSSRAEEFALPTASMRAVMSATRTGRYARPATGFRSPPTPCSGCCTQPTIGAASVGTTRSSCPTLASRNVDHGVGPIHGPRSHNRRCERPFAVRRPGGSAPPRIRLQQQGPRMGDGDGWVQCALGHRHWGRFGAAGLLVNADDDFVLQHRAPWTHEGGTGGLPGGARDSHEDVVTSALREAKEEADIDATFVAPVALTVDDHGGW